MRTRVRERGICRTRNHRSGTARDAATHLRNVFYRMGLDDAEIVALSGAHTIGRAFKARSGVTDFGYGAKNGTKFTGCPFMGTKMEERWRRVLLDRQLVVVR